MIALLLLLAQAPPCSSCHEAVVKKHATSNHALALRKAGGTQAARRFESSEINERNGAAFTYRAAGDSLQVTAEFGGEIASARLEWLFGAGAQGQTPVGRLPDGRFFEHRLSYYPPLDRVARTFGHPPGASVSAEAALGLVNDRATITRCFQCHANNVKPGPDLTRITPGVTCERCHGEGEAHRRNPKAVIVNPARFSAESILAFCADCHRSPAASVESPEVTDPVTARFAPVGLRASRCFEVSGKLSCLSCHDPHGNARGRSDVAFYQQKCTPCHTGAPKSDCPRRQDCIGCHMKQVQLTPQLRFTDHRIRVFR